MIINPISNLIKNATSGATSGLLNGIKGILSTVIVDPNRKI